MHRKSFIKIGGVLLSLNCSQRREIDILEPSDGRISVTTPTPRDLRAPNFDRMSGTRIQID